VDRVSFASTQQQQQAQTNEQKRAEKRASSSSSSGARHSQQTLQAALGGVRACVLLLSLAKTKAFLPSRRI
jgi:hypothetical protein